MLKLSEKKGLHCLTAQHSAMKGVLVWFKIGHIKLFNALQEPCHNRMYGKERREEMRECTRMGENIRFEEVKWDSTDRK